jgi:integrase
LPLLAPLFGRLPALRKALREWWLKSEFKESGHFVLATSAGRPTDHRNCLRQVTRLALRLGINVPSNQEHDADKPNLDVHSLRHVFGSACVRATNGDVEKVARWMGHRDKEMLLDVYSHEFEAARGGRKIEQDIAQLDAAYTA